MVFARVVARNQRADRVIGAIHVVWGIAVTMLVHPLDAHGAEVAVGRADGVAQGRKIIGQAVGEIEVLGLP